MVSYFMECNKYRNVLATKLKLAHNDDQQREQLHSQPENDSQIKISTKSTILNQILMNVFNLKTELLTDLVFIFIFFGNRFFCCNFYIVHYKNTCSMQTEQQNDSDIHFLRKKGNRISVLRSVVQSKTNSIHAKY